MSPRAIPRAPPEGFRGGELSAYGAWIPWCRLCRLPVSRGSDDHRTTYRPEVRSCRCPGRRPVRRCAGPRRGEGTPHPRRAAATHGRPARREGAAAPAARLPVPLVPRHRDAGDPRRPHVAARASRRHGRLRRVAEDRGPGPQPRGQRHPGRVRPGHAVRRRHRRRDHDDPHHADRRGALGLHQPERHDDELQRRPDAVGLVGDLRGDRQRSRRRAPTSRAAPTPG